MIRCPQCALENAEGAFYCARCHARLPRPLAPGECAFCGRLPEPGEPAQEVCPSCGNDAERGAAVRRLRAARLLAEANMQRDALESQIKKQSGRRRFGCLPVLFLAIAPLLASLWKR